MRTLPRRGKTSQFVRSRRAVIRPAKAILLERLKVRLGSGPVFSARSSDGPLPGVELTETGESGPMTVDLPLSGVLQS
jgi:hypothetical protein